MSDFSVRVVRADDLVVLTFDFFNLVLDSNTSGEPRRLVRVSSAAEARIVVGFQPQQISETAFDANAATPTSRARIRSMIASPSRLAFVLPPATPFLPFTLESLLDWKALVYVKPRRPDPPRAPAATDTAIEMPYRIILAPTESGRWQHRPRPFGANDRRELWHTTYEGDLSTLFGFPAPPEFPLTAVWTPDLQAGAPTSNPFPMTLNPDQRAAIVRRSARPGLVGERLRLSALGGWLTARDPSWNHDIAMGRDQKVRTQVRGVLYPFGFEVSRVITSQRKFVQTADSQGAFVIQQDVLYILDPVQKFTDRALPFKQITIAPLTVQIDVGPTGSPFVPKVKTLPFKFSLTAVDQVNRTHHFAAAMVFVPEGFTNAATVRTAYADHATVDMVSQNIGFAPDRPAVTERAAITDRTVLKAASITFGEITSGASRRFPVMTKASVTIPAAEQLYGAAAKAVTITLNEAYLAGGPTDVFADINGGMAMPLPAEKAGGLAAPNLEMTAVSALEGAFPDVKAAVANGLSQQQIVAKFFGGKLLGVVDLVKIVGFSDNPEMMPKVRPQTEPPGMAFTWTPQLTAPLPLPMKTLEGLQHGLELRGFIGADSAEVIGTLRNVALSFFNMLDLEFNHLEFTMRTGQSTKFGASLKSFTFTGQLEFVNKLTTLMPLEGFGGSGPVVKVSLEGVSAGLSIAIPTIPLGPVILQNLALKAGLNLYFFGKAASVTFGLSSKKDPFIVTYTVFGGGGYFEFSIDTEKKVELVASLGFGGAAAIDLVIAKGVIQAMVGIEFTLKNGETEIGGFVRIYGCVEILELISISVEFYMTLSYKSPYVIGSAALTVMVRVLAFSKSVTLSVQRRFSTKDGDGFALAPGADGPTITRDQWQQYCLAFAA